MHVHECWQDVIWPLCPYLSDFTREYTFISLIIFLFDIRRSIRFPGPKLLFVQRIYKPTLPKVLRRIEKSLGPCQVPAGPRQFPFLHSIQTGLHTQPVSYPTGTRLRFPWEYMRSNNFRPVSFTVRAWEWVYATNLSRLQSRFSRQCMILNISHSYRLLRSLLRG
jgi:hypothetical protein